MSPPAIHDQGFERTAGKVIGHEVAAFYAQFEPLVVDLDMAASAQVCYASAEFDVAGLIEDYATIE